MGLTVLLAIRLSLIGCYTSMKSDLKEI